MNLMMCRRTPRVLRGGISGTLELVSFRPTPRKSRLALASPAMWCAAAWALWHPVAHVVPCHGRETWSYAMAIEVYQPERVCGW